MGRLLYSFRESLETDSNKVLIVTSALNNHRYFLLVSWDALRRSPCVLYIASNGRIVDEFKSKNKFKESGSGPVELLS